MNCDEEFHTPSRSENGSDGDTVIVRRFLHIRYYRAYVSSRESKVFFTNYITVYNTYWYVIKSE